MNGTKGEVRKWSKLGKWMRERERGALQKVVKMWKRRGNALPLLLLGRWRKTVVCLAIVGLSSIRTRTELLFRVVIQVARFWLQPQDEGM